MVIRETSILSCAYGTELDYPARERLHEQEGWSYSTSFCEEGANILRDERGGFFVGEVAGVRKVHLGAGIVLREGFGTRGKKDGVACAPDSENRRPFLRVLAGLPKKLTE
jgi:hypothetical protein